MCGAVAGETRRQTHLSEPSRNSHGLLQTQITRGGALLLARSEKNCVFWSVPIICVLEPCAWEAVDRGALHRGVGVRAGVGRGGVQVGTKNDLCWCMARCSRETGGYQALSNNRRPA